MKGTILKNMISVAVLSSLYLFISLQTWGAEPDTPQTCCERATQFCNKHAEKSISQYQKALKINPKYAPAYAGLGYVYAQQENYEKAIELFNKAIKYDPQNAEAYLGLGYVHYQLKDYVKSIELHEKGLSISTESANASVYTTLGYSYNQVGEYDKAIHTFRKVFPLDPLYAAANLGIANAYEMKSVSAASSGTYYFGGKDYLRNLYIQYYKMAVRGGLGQYVPVERLYYKGPVVIGDMDPYEWYQPGLVVFDPKSKHIVLVQYDGSPEEFKGIVKDGEVIRYRNTGGIDFRCQISSANIQHGLLQIFDKKGNVQSTWEVKNGIVDGLVTAYYPDGKIHTKTTYRHGWMNGPQVMYYPNGQVAMECQYKYNQNDGTSKTYTSDGKLILHCVHQDGEQTDIYYDGTLLMDVDALNGPKIPTEELNAERAAEKAAWDGNKILRTHDTYPSTVKIH